MVHREFVDQLAERLAIQRCTAFQESSAWAACARNVVLLRGQGRQRTLFVHLAKSGAGLASRGYSLGMAPTDATIVAATIAATVALIRLLSRPNYSMEVAAQRTEARRIREGTPSGQELHERPHEWG